MKIKDIYNLPRQSSYDIEKIFTLKEWGRSIFPAQNNLGVDWEMLKKNVPGLKAFSVETSLNKFYIVSINNQQFILLNYDKVLQIHTSYCTDSSLYETLMKLLIAHSSLSYCFFSAKIEDNVTLPDDDGYYIECDD